MASGRDFRKQGLLDKKHFAITRERPKIVRDEFFDSVAGASQAISDRNDDIANVRPGFLLVGGQFEQGIL